MTDIVPEPLWQETLKFAVPEPMYLEAIFVRIVAGVLKSEFGKEKLKL